MAAHTGEWPSLISVIRVELKSPTLAEQKVNRFWSTVRTNMICTKNMFERVVRGNRAKRDVSFSRLFLESGPYLRVWSVHLVAAGCVDQMYALLGTINIEVSEGFG